MQDTYTYSYLSGFGQETSLTVEHAYSPRGSGSIYEYKDSIGRVIRKEKITQDKEENIIFENEILVDDLSDGFFIKTDRNNTIRRCEAVVNSALNGLTEEYDADGHPYSTLGMKDNKPHGKYTRPANTDEGKVTTFYWEGKPVSQFICASMQNYEDIQNGEIKPIVKRIQNLGMRLIGK